MQISGLQKYNALYTNSKVGGASIILNSSLNFDKHQAVPVSISHGVDFGMMKLPMDYAAAEPLHWAYNRIIQNNARGLKDVVKIPHPWWFLFQQNPARKGSNILVIGPPPSRTNDTRLYACLKKENIIGPGVSILLKNRQSNYNSEEFWRQYNFGIENAGPSDYLFYHRLYRILNKYESIILCTLSSAAFFSASMGKTVYFLTDFRYKAYDINNYNTAMNFESQIAKGVAHDIIHDTDTKKTELARRLLGFTQRSMHDLRNEYLEKIETVNNPIYHSGILNRTMAELAVKANDTRLYQPNLLAKLRNRIITSTAVLKEINEISVWKNGVNACNYKVKNVKYRKGITEPGSGAD